jgi:hypothetical protein
MYIIDSAQPLIGFLWKTYQHVHVFRSTQAIKQAATPNSAYPQHQQNANKVHRAMSRASKQIGTNVTK